MKKLILFFILLSLLFFYKTGYFDTIKLSLENINKNQKFKIEKDIGDNNKLNNLKADLSENFKKIKIGDTKESVINKLNEPSRIDNSECNFKWYIYNNYKEKFFMIGIEDNKVVALFTNNINSCENEGIDIEKDINYIRNNFEILKYKDKKNIRYEISSNNEYDIIYINNKYITVFYDKFNNNKIWAYEIIEKSTEEETESIYPELDKNIENSFMLEIIDLVNATRYKNNLEPLLYNEKATISAKKHSEDMRNNNYFNHKNLNHETPFDRMIKEGIKYSRAGENIAAGQTNGIFAMNGWMNSEGHRKNILGNYKYIGVGVIFGGNYKTYYTQNFFA